MIILILIAYLLYCKRISLLAFKNFSYPEIVRKIFPPKEKGREKKDLPISVKIFQGLKALYKNLLYKYKKRKESRGGGGGEKTRKSVVYFA